MFDNSTCEHVSFANCIRNHYPDIRIAVQPDLMPVWSPTQNDGLVINSYQALIEDHQLKTYLSRKVLRSTKSSHAGLHPERSSHSTATGISIAWLMSFPNSGTSYTLKATRRASSISFATNYGEETLEESPRGELSPLIYPSIPSGPFWSCCETDECPYICPEEGFVLTKTHCAGFGITKGLESKDTFLTGCLRYTTPNDELPRTYDIDLVKKAVHLIRDPFDNVVSRFHHERNNRMSSMERGVYDNSHSGFRAFCRDKVDGIDLDLDEGRVAFPEEILSLLENVPCRMDFLRYIGWHNRAFQVSSDTKIPTLVLHYESYASNWDDTMANLLDFIGMAKKEDTSSYHFKKGKEYRSFYLSDEVEKLRSAFLAFASDATKSNTMHYFEETRETPLPFLLDIGRMGERKNHQDQRGKPRCSFG